MAQPAAALNFGFSIADFRFTNFLLLAWRGMAAAVATASALPRRGFFGAPEARAAISQAVAEQEFDRATEFLVMAEKFLEGTGGNFE